MQAATYISSSQAEPGVVLQLPGAINAYRDQQLKNLSPVRVIEKLYSTAILACKKGDHHLAHKALNELVVSLNFEQKEMALGLFRLYEYCKRCLRNEKAGEAITILEELRTAWVEAFHLPS